MDSKESKYNLLIVDDSPNWVDLLQTVFEDDFQVSVANSYVEAKQLLTKYHHHFEVAIIDLRLDDSDPKNEDGLRLLRVIQENQIRTTPIILTGYPTISSTKIAFRDLGAFEYIEKYSKGGLDLSALRKVVYSALVNKKILVIEDDEGWNQVLSDILTEDGYQVDSVNNSVNARNLIKKNKYPITIVDLKLGSESPDQGIDLLEYAHRVTPKSGIVVVSGYGDAERVRDAFERGRAKAFIFKDGFDPEKFRQKVRSLTSSIRIN